MTEKSDISVMRNIMLSRREYGWIKRSLVRICSLYCSQPVLIFIIKYMSFREEINRDMKAVAGCRETGAMSRYQSWTDSPELN